MVKRLIDNKLTGIFGTYRTSVKVKDGVVLTISLSSTRDYVPSATLSEGNLFERFNETNFYLILVMWDEAHESNIYNF